MRRAAAFSTIGAFLAVACQAPEPTLYDVHISGGMVFDGETASGVSADVLIDGDRIVFVGDAKAANLAGRTQICLLYTSPSPRDA